MPEFPAITLVALTVSDLGRSRPWYSGSSAQIRSSMKTPVLSTTSSGSWGGRSSAFTSSLT